MINPAKIFKMQQEAKQMQKKLRERKVSGSSKDGRVVIFMNLAQEFEDIHIDESLLAPDSLGLIKKLMEEAFKDFQKTLQKEAMKDMDLDQIKKMLG
ncbi:MAG: Nucleoid-associated protein [candidate division WS6 bacterium GW2011_GWF2_39_15]|uniref:Nucleoid-associated protein n=1 Tax=candidate division WS6 bacterium GW2011_GWF2_39_15 TaxID=1619100 RepID=A0A0G0Q7D4_9BACT|nr:MAG: Nucleoid-associated protein [candidate division WS6 bacterium GW2011_GWF2_39_15]